ncbi:Uncharacterised protein [Citrobacter koseri]|uniref:Uncharacterized protein n=1 Tax=Citrobacter koseri TaxID=545 RepID=A0A2X2V6J2_CITKO|nr:Uncharacterised protein [Citrobacter koseri]
MAVTPYPACKIPRRPGKRSATGQHKTSAATCAAFPAITRILPLTKKFFVSHWRLIRVRHAHMLNVVVIVRHANHQFCRLTQIFPGLRKRYQTSLPPVTQMPSPVKKRAAYLKISARLSPAPQSLQRFRAWLSYGVSCAVGLSSFSAAKRSF